MRIKMKMDVAGSFHNIDGGVRAGQVVDVQPDEEAARYVALGYAEEVAKSAPKVEKAVASPKVETAALTTEQAAVLTEVEADKPHAPAKKAAPKATPAK